MTNKEIANLLQLNIKTVTTYQKTNNAPKPIIISLMLIGGHIPNFTQRNDFKGWSFGQGYLWSPSGEKYTSGDILASRIDKALIRELDREIKHIKKQSLVRESAQIIPFPVKYSNHKCLA
jgi:hypothetical protein